MKRNRVCFLTVLALFLLAGMLPAMAEEVNEGGAADIMKLADTAREKNVESDKKKDFSFHGFLRADFVTMKRDKEFDKNFENPLMGAILQLQFEGHKAEMAHFYAAVNIEYNNYDEDNPNEFQARPYLKLIEAYIDLYPARWFSLRAGHQLMTWGEIDGIMAPTDIICPWDYTIKTTSFEEYKIGVTALAGNFFIKKKHKMELVWIPVFQPSKLPPEEVAKRGEIFAVIPAVTRPEYKLENGEYAARLSGSIGDNFRYGLAFLYGYDDLPNTTVTLTPSIAVDLNYDRVMTPTLDLSYDIKDLFALKASAAFKITDDFSGSDYEKRNSTLEYLAGIESTNIGMGIYLSFYAGQMWVINYTEPLGTQSAFIEGFDQDYRYKWLISSVMQRYFLANDVLELSLRYALSADPGFTDIDYTINFNTTYKVTSGVSVTLGFVIADKIDVIQNTVLLEMKYEF